MVYDMTNLMNDHMNNHIDGYKADHMTQHIVHHTAHHMIDNPTYQFKKLAVAALSTNGKGGFRNAS